MKKLKRILAVVAVLVIAVLTGYFIYTGVQLNRGETAIGQVQNIQYMF